MLFVIKKVLRLLYWCSGWKYVEEIPKDIDKAVMIMIGHTSNWDFLYGIGCLDYFNRHARFTIKKEWIEVPLVGRFFKLLGAFAVDRSKKNSAVEQMIEEIKSWDKGYMIVTPEGTRRRVTKLRTGFYHVALGAGIPIILSYIDYKRKQSGLGQVLYPSGNYEKDMKVIYDFYSNITPKKPENFALSEFSN